MGVAIILLFAALSHIGALSAVWFMDDPAAIVYSPMVTDGRWFLGGMRSFTCLTYWVTYAACGMSSAAFHAGNILIHCFQAVCIYLFSGIFIREMRGADKGTSEADPTWFPLVAALIFAVHPLSGEITHYARSRDHELVGLFSFLTAVFTVLSIRGGVRWLPSLALVVLLGALSKEQGVVQCLLSAGIVGAFYWRDPESLRKFKEIPKRFFAYAAAATGLLAIIFFTKTVFFWWQAAYEMLASQDLAYHTLTQSRVVWEYLFRMVIPVLLCPDHQIAMTVSYWDFGAWLAFATAIAALLGILHLYRRGYSLWAFFMAMTLAPIFIRFAYVVETTLMVEYRAYPSLPWVCMMFSLGLCRIFQGRPQALKTAALVVVLSFSFITFNYGKAWQSTDLLTGHILRTYPTQLRAIIENNGYALFRGNYGLVIARTDDFRRRVLMIGEIERRHPERRYRGVGYFAARFNLQRAEALVEVGSCDAALGVLQNTWSLIVQSQGDQRFGELEAEWHLVRSLAEAGKGNVRTSKTHRDLAFLIDGSPMQRAREAQALSRLAREQPQPGVQTSLPGPENEAPVKTP